jgi:hypothetical protein
MQQFGIDTGFPRSAVETQAMKRPPKVRWYAGWILSLGILFLLLACANFVATSYVASRYRIVTHTGPKSGPGTNFAALVGSGFLLTGLGAYAMWHRND